AEQVAAFTRLGVEVVAVDSRPGGAAARIADAAEVVTLTDPEALTALLRRVAPGYVVSATDAVAAGALAAFEDDGATVAQIQALVRASDPIYEMGCRVGIAHKSEDAFWHGTLRSLAARFGVNGIVQQRNSLIDPRMQWSAAGDVWHNAAVRTTLYAPVNAVQRLFTPG
ncbi:MAG: hypothetical protein KDE45_20790, partial [Caldilineaceae bacterium]|nr:hypothetical protein [Caldilineaceae bacterium]